MLSIIEIFKRRSKHPWACFITEGFSDEGLGVKMHWNKAFIKHLHEHGIQGATEEETVQLMFLYLSSRISGFVIDSTGTDTNTINPEATPQLTNEANTFIR